MPAKKKICAHGFSAEERVGLVLKGLRNPGDIAAICEETGISNETYALWESNFVKGGTASLRDKSDKQTAAMDDELYKKIVHSFPANILVSRPDDGAILFRSETTQATYGVRERTSEHWMEQSERAVFIDQLNETGRVDNMMFHGRKHDGTGFPAQLSAQMIEHNGQSISISTSTDLSRFYAMREEIEHAGKLLRDAIEALDEGVMLYDADLRLELFNQKANDLFFNGEGSFQLGKTFYELCDFFAMNGLLEMPEGLDKEDWARFAEADVRNYAQNTELTTAEGRLLLATSHKSNLGGYLLTFKDVTEQRRARQAEEEADLLLKLIIEASPTTFLVSRVDDGKIIYYPSSYDSRFAQSEYTSDFFLDPKDRASYINALLPSGVLDDYPIRFRQKDGTIMDGLISARVINYKGEDVIVSSTRDISEQLAMQRQLDQQKEITHQNEKLSALGELLAGVAHELNNPLSIVVGYSLMLQDKVSDPVIDKRIKRIGQAAERCAKIVKMFLAMARQRPIELEHCAVNELIESTLDVAGYGFRSSGGRVKLELDPELPAVSADPDQLAQVITNLVINAEQALKEQVDEPRIKVKTRFDNKNRKVVIKVYDNGKGIPKRLQSRVFEPFFTTKEVGTGTGVGLAFCHRTITAHSGTLTLESKQGEGTTFTIRLPIAARPAGRNDGQKDELAADAGHTILVVDDEEVVTELIHDILTEKGYQVTTANDPEIAIELANSASFDAILSDMKMPNMGGDQFYASLMDKSPGYIEKFAFITGDVMRSEVSRFLETGKVPYLEKPVSPEELLTLVRTLCRRKSEKSS